MAKFKLRLTDHTQLYYREKGDEVFNRNLNFYNYSRALANHYDSARDRIKAALESAKNIGIDELISFAPDDVYMEEANNVGIEVAPVLLPIRKLIEKGGKADTPRNKQLCVNSEEVRANGISIIKNAIKDYGSEIKTLEVDATRDISAKVLLQEQCECQACKEIRKRWFGHEILTEEERKNPAIIYKELSIKIENLIGFMREIRKLSKDAGLGLSAAVRACYTNQPNVWEPPVNGLGPALIEGQDWVRWVEMDLVDNVGPMSYFLHLEEYTQALSDHIRLVTPAFKHKISNGIGVASSLGRNPSSQVEKYIRIAVDAGLSSCYFFAFCHFTDSDFETIKLLKDVQTKDNLD